MRDEAEATPLQLTVHGPSAGCAEPGGVGLVDVRVGEPRDEAPPAVVQGHVELQFRTGEGAAMGALRVPARVGLALQRLVANGWVDLRVASSPSSALPVNSRVLSLRLTDHGPLDSSTLATRPDAVPVRASAQPNAT